MQNKYYIDIFSGCGGFAKGLLEAGWRGIFAIEKNPEAFATFKYNLIDKNQYFDWPAWLSVTPHDINTVIKDNKKELMSLRGKVKLVAGGPPCQGFSLAGKRNHKDQRNTLVKSYVKFIDLLQPDMILFENVYGFTFQFANKDGIKKYSSYVEEKLIHMGYQVDHRLINMADYGVPQNRRRFILIGMKHDNPQTAFEELEKESERLKKEKALSEKTSAQEALSDLERSHGISQSPDSKGFMAGLYGEIESNYQKMMRAKMEHETGTIADSHRFVNHSDRIVQLHKDLLEKATPGERITPNNQIGVEIKRRNVTVLGRGLQAPTITSIPDEIVHYSEPRILTVREYARLQSFPDDYVFLGRYTSGGKQRKNEVCRYTQIGNAVPPLFAEMLGRVLLSRS